MEVRKGVGASVMEIGEGGGLCNGGRGRWGPQVIEVKVGCICSSRGRKEWQFQLVEVWGGDNSRR